MQRGAELARRSEALTVALRACAQDEAEHSGAERDAAARAGSLEREAAHAEERLAELRARAAELAEQHGLAAVDAVEPLPPEELAGLSARVERLERRRGELGAVNPLAKQELEEQRERARRRAHAGRRPGGRDARARARHPQPHARDPRALRGDVRAGAGGLRRGRGHALPGRPRALRPDRPRAAWTSARRRGRAAEPPEPGVELEIQPAGKRLASMGLLSGGERSLGALAFLFALMLARPSPFYVLDEVDAALDDANIARFLELIERYRERAQFIIITHQQLTMEIADVALRRLDGRRRRLHRALAPRARARGRLVASAGRGGAARPGARARASRASRRSAAAASSRACARTCGRSSRALAQGLNELAFDPNDDGVWERLEELLIAADVGVPATVEIVQALEAEAAAGRLHTPEELRDELQRIVAERLAQPLERARSICAPSPP